MSEWISVEDRLPEMQERYKGGPKKARVLVFTGSYVCEGRYEETYARRIPGWKSATNYVISVTHWMPLPSPPEQPYIPVGAI